MRRLLLVLAFVIPRSLNGQGFFCDDIQSPVVLNARRDSAYVGEVREVDSLYKAAVAALATDMAQEAALVRSQRAWTGHREAQRELLDTFAGAENPHGSVMWSMIPMVWKRGCFLALLAEARYPPPQERCR